MKLQDLDYDFPEELVATDRASSSRVLWTSRDGDGDDFCEVSVEELLERIQPGDLLVLNDTKVQPRRVFCARDLEVLFLEQTSERKWKVLMPARKLKKSPEFELPGGVMAKLVEKGKPQVILLDREFDEAYFDEYGELPLPPYIQKKRGTRQNKAEDKKWYQTAWAENAGSLAAPTASLHFQQKQIDQLVSRGVFVEKVTLHVGLGTFLPISTEDLDEHEMHFEIASVPFQTVERIKEVRRHQKTIWAMGTTVTRTLESYAKNMLAENSDGSFSGETNLFIKPGFKFEVVDRLLTNFHQPKSTLLALVGAFAGMDFVKRAYKYAVDREFRLFSYGDLSVWEREKKR